MVLRFRENWSSRSNLFDQPGEIILSLMDEGEAIAMCGRNIDPYDESPRAGRVRHLYVLKAHRLKGAGRRLLEAVLADAPAHFDYLNTNAPPAAYGFYERLGFKRVIDSSHCTHRIMLKP